MARHSGREIADGDWRHKFDRGLYSIFERPRWHAALERDPIPALLVKGERSDRVNDRILGAIRERAPQMEFAAVAASDHHVTLDNPCGLRAGR